MTKKEESLINVKMNVKIKEVKLLRISFFQIFEYVKLITIVSGNIDFICNIVRELKVSGQSCSQVYCILL